MWLSNCYITDGWIVGDVWDDSEVGDWSLPDDYTGEWQTYGFPISCIRKDPCNLLENKEGGDAGQQDARLSREHDKSTSNRKLKAERKRK